MVVKQLLGGRDNVADQSYHWNAHDFSSSALTARGPRQKGHSAVISLEAEQTCAIAQDFLWSCHRRRCRLSVLKDRTAPRNRRRHIQANHHWGIQLPPLPLLWTWNNCSRDSIPLANPCSSCAAGSRMQAAAHMEPRTYGEGFSSGFARFQHSQEFWDVSACCSALGRCWQPLVPPCQQAVASS